MTLLEELEWVAAWVDDLCENEPVTESKVRPIAVRLREHARRLREESDLSWRTGAPLSLAVIERINGGPVSREPG